MSWLPESFLGGWRSGFSITFITVPALAIPRGSPSSDRERRVLRIGSPWRDGFGLNSPPVVVGVNHLGLRCGSRHGSRQAFQLVGYFRNSVFADSHESADFKQKGRWIDWSSKSSRGWKNHEDRRLVDFGARNRG